MKRKIICLLLSLAVVFSFSPIFTIQADAFSTGSTSLINTKTVTIKPGKTYNSPKFKLKKKMLLQVPMHVSSKKEVTKGGFVISVKDSKKKVKAKYKESLKNIGGEDGFDYDDWIYFYMSKKKSKACFKKGKYSISIKNTTNATIKVKFSVKGYTKYASDAKFNKSKTIDYGSGKKFKYLNAVFPYTYLGRVGPGMPVVSSIKSSNKDVYIGSDVITPDGKVYAYIDTEKEEASSVISVKLKNRKTPYKIKVKVKQ